MRRSYSLILIVLFSTAGLKAQIVIDDSHMPQPGDTVRRSNTFILDGMDYEESGPGFTWDFSSLMLSAQQVDTFVSVEETPVIFQLFFNNQFIYPDYKATVAYKLSAFSSIPGIQITDSYQFFKNTPESYREVGYGITYQGLNIPVQYDRIDTIYRFPLTYGSVDSASAFFEIEVPDIGYLSMDRYRKNTADGWGTIITPYGQFQALRVKTEIHEFDSIYIDSLNIGIPLDRNIVEYKWLAEQFPVPVFQVTVEGFLATASYIDSVQSLPTGLTEYQGENVRFLVYPNPSDDFVSVSYELLKDSEVSLSLYSLYGQELECYMQSTQERGLYNRVLYLKEYGYTSGIYLLRLTVNNIPYIKRLVLN